MGISQTLPPNFPRELEVCVRSARYKGRDQLRSSYLHEGKRYKLVVNYPDGKDRSMRVKSLDHCRCLLVPDGRTHDIIFCRLIKPLGTAVAKRELRRESRAPDRAKTVRSMIPELVRFRQMLSHWA